MTIYGQQTKKGGGGGAGNTDLSISNKTGTSFNLNSSTGTGATIPPATDTEAGLLSAAEKNILNNTAGVNSGDNAPNSTSNAYADSLVVGLWDDRGSYDASVNSYPSSGGSGTAGAIFKGDVWTISVAGTLPTSQVVEIGDLVRALVNTPGNTQANWAITQNNIGYVAENISNKSVSVSIDQGSDVKYPSVKAVYDWVTGLGYLLSSTAASTYQAISAKDATGGYVGLTLFKINFKNAANTFTSFFTNSNTAARTYTFQDRNGTIADDTDIATKVDKLSPTAIKTASYNALVNDFVITDATSGNIPITLPAAPADKSIIAIKMIAVGAGFSTTITTSGSDVFNKTGGSTTGSLSLLNQAMILQYKATGGIWYVVSDDLSLSQLDIRYSKFPIREAMVDSNKTFSTGTTEMYQSVVLTAPRTLTLPAASVFSAGTELTYVDEIGGITSVNNVTVTRAGSDTINGVTTLVFNVTNGVLKLISDGVSKWTSNKQIIYSEGTWTPTWGGFSVDPTTPGAAYTTFGRLCNVMVNPGAGTSNATTMTMTLPFTALIRQNFVIEAMNNGVLISTLAQTTAGSNVLTVFGTLAGAGFTASGSKLAYINFTYTMQ